MTALMFDGIPPCSLPIEISLIDAYDRVLWARTIDHGRLTIEPPPVELVSRRNVAIQVESANGLITRTDADGSRVIRDAQLDHRGCALVMAKITLE